MSREIEEDSEGYIVFPLQRGEGSGDAHRCRMHKNAVLYYVEGESYVKVIIEGDRSSEPLIVSLDIGKKLIKNYPPRRF